jgi:protein CpxP
MFSLSHRASISRATARSAAIASLLGATFLFTPLAASADSLANHHRHARHATSEARAESVEQRIADLHASLKITPSEEINWTAVAQVMRDNEARMQSLISARKAEPVQGENAVEHLKTYERFTQTHVDGLKMLISSFETLYNSMPVDQKRVADQVFEKFGHRRESQG